MSLLFLTLMGLAQAETPEVEIGGYVAPGFKATYRPSARPVDQQRIGMDGSKAGLIFKGNVTNPWRFKVHLVMGGDSFQALTAARPVWRRRLGPSFAGSVGS